VQSFQKSYLNESGVSSNDIALITSLLLLPFVLKLIFAFVADLLASKVANPKKLLMRIGLFISAAGFAAAATVDPADHFYVFTILMLAASSGTACYDTCADGLAIVISSTRERSYIQAAMISGKSAGFIIMAGLFGLVGQRFGYPSILLSLGALSLLPLALLSSVQEPIAANKTFQPLKELRWLLTPHTLCFIAFAFSYAMISFGGDGLMSYFLKLRFDTPIDQLGSYGSLRGIGAIFGAISSALLVIRVGFKRLGSASLMCVAIVLWFTPQWLTPENRLSFAALWGFVWGLQEGIFLTLAMNLSPKKFATTAFALFMMVGNLGTAVGDGSSTALVDTWGFVKVFHTLALMSVVPLILYNLCLFLTKRQEKLQLDNVIDIQSKK